MSIQQPVWLKRTRPCPFFSQGRCLFADSCNFLHDVKVKSAIYQPLLSAIPVEQSSRPQKPVFDPPSVVVNSASPRSVNLVGPQSTASSAQESSRYSGLLSVLSDVIGPPSDPIATTQDAVPRSREVSAVLLQSAARSHTSLPSESRSFGAAYEPTSATPGAKVETGQTKEPSSILEPDFEATLVNPFGEQRKSLFLEAGVVPDEEAPADEDTTCFFEEDLDAYVIGTELEEHGDDDRDIDNCGKVDHTAMLSNRQSALSSFTGASLLNSPRRSVFREPSVTSPIGNGVVDLLSPVQLSAKLRPFSIPSSGPSVMRGDSIDSGYADGDSWVSPLPFPRSPPGSFRSPVMFPSYSRRASVSSPALKEGGTFHDVGTLRTITHNIEVIKEVESNGCLEDNEDTAVANLGANGSSPKEGKGGAYDSLQVTVEEKAEEHGWPSEIPGSLHYSPEHLHPTRDCDLHPSNQASYISDDSLSFKTALSTQPSYEDLSDVSRISPVKQDSLLPYLSSCSTRDTSMLSHYGDAKEFSEQLIVGMHVQESSCPISQIDDAGVLEARASDEYPFLEEVAICLDVRLAPASGDLQGLAPEKVVTPQGSLFGAPYTDRRSPMLSSSVDTSHGLSSAKLVLGHVSLATPGKVVDPHGRLSGVFNSDEPELYLSHTPSVTEVFARTPGTDDHRESSLENAAAPGERFPFFLHHGRPRQKSNQSISSYASREDVLGYAPASTSNVQKCDPQTRLSSPTPSSSDESPRGLSSVEGIPHDAPQDTDRRHNGLPVNATQNYMSNFDKHLQKPSLSTETSHSASAKNIHEPASGGDAQELVSENVVASQHPLPRVWRFTGPSPKSSPSAKRSRIPSTIKGVLKYALPDASDKDARCSELSSAVLRDPLAEHIASEPSQSLVAENGLGSAETTESFDSERDNFTRRLSFPLPLFLPADIVGHSILGGKHGSFVPRRETAAVNVRKDESNADAVPQDVDVEQINSGSVLTEKARPSQLPSVEHPESDTNFTLRRSRAVSDLTVKGSPATLGDSHATRPPPPLLEQLGRSDSVHSLYDQYFDDGVSNGIAENPVCKDTTPLDVTNPAEVLSQEEHPQSLDLTPHVIQRVPSSPSSDVGKSSTDSPVPETALLPLLTGRRPFLRSSLAELVPKAISMGSSLTHSSTRMRAREIGSTMVPLGFRRHKFRPVTTKSSQPLHTASPAPGLTEVLRIRTDINVVREDSPPRCYSASHVPSTTWSPLPAKAMSAPPTDGLRELHLSSIINKRSSILSSHSSSITSSILSLDRLFNSPTPQSPSASSTTSFSHNSLLSSSCEQIPEQIHHTLRRPSSNSPILQANNDVYFTQQSSPTRSDSCSVSAPTQQLKSWRLSHYRAGSRSYTPADGTHRFTRRASTLSLSYTPDEEQEMNGNIRSERTVDSTRPASVLTAPIHAIATPKPNLLFAIASDDVDRVRQVLENGEASPNDSVGPQSALAFTLTNDELTHKQEIVKALLAYGANPSALWNSVLNPAPRKEGNDGPSGPPLETTLEGMDPATRYFVARAGAAHTRQTSQLIYRSFFRPLTRVRYDVIGQDWALEQLFRVLGMRSQKLAVAPIVVLLCGPSGHGKSLLARKFGSLLDVPTHTVNMTTLRSAHDIWQSHSMSPYEEPSSCTLAEFLTKNEGKRCVVVLDEIEKVEDQKALWSLLMPWELGRCSLSAGKRHIDARDVIWLGTSNVGHELVFEHHQNRAEPDERMSREDYLELMAILRPRVSDCLGASLVSRVTTVLPFVPFTLDEKKAIAAETVYALAGNASRTLSPQDVESLVTKALLSYQPSEGARSLHRATSSILVGVI